MFRKSDWIGVVGIAMLMAGAVIFFSTGGEYLPVWISWLVGPLLWYGGFLMTTLWFMTRIFGAQRAVEQKRVAERKPATVSNFLEHDANLIVEQSKSKLVAY